MTIFDPLLINLMEAAERGEKCPHLVLVVGPWIVQGQLVSTQIFLEENHSHIQKRVLGGLKGRDRANPAAEDTASRIAAQHLSPLGTAHGATTLCLSLLRVTFSNNDTVSVPAVRLPISSVDSWWVSDHSVEGRKIRGGGVAVDFNY